MLIYGVMFATGAQKRKRSADTDDTTVQKLKRHISCHTDGLVGFGSNVGLTDKSSMQLSRHHGSRNYDVSVSEAPMSTRTVTVTRKAKLEGKPDLNCITTKPRKRSRPCRWKRLRGKKQKQSTAEDNLNTECNLLPTNTDVLHANLQHDNTSLSCHDKVTNCFCEIL